MALRFQRWPAQRNPTPRAVILVGRIELLGLADLLRVDASNRRGQDYLVNCPRHRKLGAPVARLWRRE